MKRRIAPLVGDRVRLRLLEERDLPLTLAWRNRDDVRRWFVSSERITPEQHWAWYARYVEDDTDFLFVIEYPREQGRAVGQLGLYRIDWADRRAEFGRLLLGEPSARGLGLAREATELLVSYGFDRLGLREIELHVFRENRIALALYRRCGFRESAETGDLARMTLTR